MALIRIDENTVENKKDGRRWVTKPDGTISTIIPDGWRDNLVRTAKGKDNFDKWVSRLCKDRKDFTIIKNGSYWSIKSPTLDYEVKFNHKEKKVGLSKGKHLITVLRKAVENYSGVIPDGLVEPKMIYNNPDALIEDIHYRVLDLNRAYWTAAFRLGYITELQWLSGLNDDWKLGGVAAVGCLKREIREDVYVGGVLVVENKVINRDCKYSNARLHIINHVADIMIECARIAGRDKWVKVHVDAITMHPTADMVRVKEYLSSLGFGFKWLNIILNI